MYILVVVILVGARIVRDFRPLDARECLASAAAIAADGVARGLAGRRREVGLSMVERARAGGADPQDVAKVRALLMSADTASDRLDPAQRRVLRLVPGFFAKAALGSGGRLAVGARIVPWRLARLARGAARLSGVSAAGV